MRAQPKSHQSMLSHLEELKRKENLELLRAPLTEYNLFPYDKDPRTATITVEELKKLVRHWKLHEARGFWKTHSEKEDLMRALLDYMHHHNLYNNRVQASQKKIEPKRPDKPKANRPRQQNHTKRILKPYNGDLFGRFDTSDGLLYLSRMDPDLPKDHKQPMKGGNLNALSVLGNLAPPSESSSRASFTIENGENAITEGEPSLPQNNEQDLYQIETDRQEEDTKVSVAEQLYQFSISEGSELRMVEEGVLQALSQVIGGCNDFRIDFYCSATILNLTFASDAREAMVDRGVIQGCILPILSSPAGDDTTAIFCAKALYNLTCQKGIEDKIFERGAGVLTNLVSLDNDDVKLYACAATVNIFPCLERHRLVDPLIPALATLATHQHQDMHRILCEVVYRMAIYEFLRTTMVDLGIVSSLVIVSEEEELPLDLCVLLASAISNLSCASEARDKMVRAGAVGAVRDLARAAVEDIDPTETEKNLQLELKKLCSSALCNLSFNEKLGTLVVEAGAVPTLVEVGLGATDLELKTKVAGALANLTMSQNLSMLGRMVEEGAHRVLMELVTHKPSEPQSEDAAQHLEMVSLVVSALCNLLYDQSHHQTMVTQGILETLTLVLTSSASLSASANGMHETVAVRTVTVAFSNLSMSADYVDRFISSGFVKAVVDLVKKTRDTEVQRTCVDAFGYLSGFLSIGSLLIDSEFVSAVASIGIDHANRFSDSSSLENTQTSMMNMSLKGKPNFDDTTHGDEMSLLEENSMENIDEEDCALEVMTRCADVLCNLSLEEDFCVPLIEQGGLECTLRFCEMDDSGILARCSSILCRLSMSNVSGSEVRVGLSLLEQKSSDKDVMHSCSLAMFAMSCQPDVVEEMTKDPVMLKRLISLMREGVGQTQAYSAKALCNLSRHRTCAKILLDHGVVADLVVIALLRTNSEEIKEICSQSLFNLLVHEECRPKMVEQGVVWALMKLARLESLRTQDICAQTLFNLSYDASTAKVIVDLGMVPVLENVVINDPPAGEQTQRYLGRTLVNLCGEAPYATRLAEDGVVPVLAELVKTKSEDVSVDCTTTFRLLCRPEVGKHTKITEGKVVRVLENLWNFRPASAYDVIACLHYLSVYAECRPELMEQKVAQLVIKLLQDTNETELVQLALAMLYHITFEESSCLQLAEEGVALCVSVHSQSNPLHKPITMEIFRMLSYVSETHTMLAGEAADISEQLVNTLASQEATLTTRRSAAVALRNLSYTSECCAFLLSADLLPTLTTLLARGSFSSPDELEMARDVSITLRNITCSPHQPAKMVVPELSFLPLLRGIAERGDNELRDHLAFCLVNLVLDDASKAGITDQGGPAVLSYLANNVSTDEVKQMCAAAIASQSNRSVNEFVEGSVIALMSIIDQPGNSGKTKHKSEPTLNVEKCLRPIPPEPHVNTGEPVLFDVRDWAKDDLTAKWETFICPLEGVVFCSVAEARRKVEPKLCDLNKPLFTQTDGEFTKILIEIQKMNTANMQSKVPPTVPETNG